MVKVTSKILESADVWSSEISHFGLLEKRKLSK
jgi:hypothetical protein